ncbi:DUF4232 domain-containing protein [Actinoplanes sp. NPDC024001]|uniref:DUF4232 domain-containing protein n=1 Tax=Actinoplanes sp. NPDC024001 TaxID=3154598 RepID=UPI0033F146D9
MHRTMMAAAAAGLLLAAGGCATATAGEPSAAPATPPPTVAPSPTDSATTAAPDPATSRTATAPRTTATRTPARPAVERCLTRNLKVTDDADDGGAAAGHHIEFLVFENTAGFSCTLTGFPGVSFVAGAEGRQVGSAFLRTNATRRTVTLTPGSRVHAAILIADYRNVDTATCKPVRVRGYRVYPPNETAAVFVPAPQTACSAPNQAAGQVNPVAPGTSGA